MSGPKLLTDAVGETIRSARATGMPMRRCAAAAGVKWTAVVEWLRKGRKVYAEGRLQVDLYDSKEGEKRVALDILASEVVIVDRNPDADPNAPRAPRSSAPSQGTPEESSQSAPSDLDDLPF